MDGDCPICQLKMILPTSAGSCGHKFCFCCIKAVVLGNPMCACPICRRDVDRAFFERPSMSGIDLDMADPEAATPKKKIKKEVKDEPDDDTNPRPHTANGGPAKRERGFWLYKGRSGWWRYDPRVEKEIEDGHSGGLPLVEVSICGHTYIVDLTTNKQYRKDQGVRMSRDCIRCDTITDVQQLTVLGIAGVRLT